MKKAKLLLSGIAVLAVVGSALAFKAQKEFKVLWTGTTNDQCFKTISVETTNVPAAGTLLYFTTTGPTDPGVATTCPDQTYIKSTINQ